MLSRGARAADAIQVRNEAGGMLWLRSPQVR
jgi:hypothetical protein